MHDTEHSLPPESETAAGEPRENLAPIIQVGTEPGVLQALIAQQPFFRGLGPRQLEQLTEAALLMQFEAGQQIFSEGEPANRFYLILEGQVVLESEGDEHGMTPLQTLGPGEDVGWSWLFRPYYLHFGARALTATKVLFFYGARLRQRCEEDHELGYELLKRVGEVVVQRLELMRRKLSESTGVRSYRD